MLNDRLDEAQAEIKIAGRNINKLRFSDDTTVMAESEEVSKGCRQPGWPPGQVPCPESPV